MRDATQFRSRRLGLLVPGLLLFAAPSTLRAETYAEPNPHQAIQHTQQGSTEVAIRTVSARNDMASGGDVLLRVTPKAGIDTAALKVTRNGTDVTAGFKRVGSDLLGLVTGLNDGDNAIEVSGPANLKASLVVTNYAAAGPIFSGPRETPFYCQTNDWVDLPGKLGAPIDKNCSIATRVDYAYVTKDNKWKALPDLGARPDDIAQMKSTDGTMIPFIVRVETGTINRGVYQITMPFDARDPQPDFATRNRAWNGALLYTFGGGCQNGWYVQGAGTGGVYDIPVLSRGMAVASNSLNVFGNNCNDLLSSETMMMTKERFIEAYGLPKYTMGWGSSGGSYQQHQTADNYPGLLDSLMTGMTFPDVLGTVQSGVDAWLLGMYFSRDNQVAWTADQQRAVTGYGSFGSIAEMTFRAQRTNPYANWSNAVPQEVRYDWANNPTGARATVFDHTVNVYGRDSKTGFARRPLDNVGVQYGLQALNEGVITVAQFLDLNEKIGGLDADAHYQTARMVADPDATRLAYATGRILSTGGGMANIPIVDYRSYLDLDPNGNVHQRYNSFSVRDRLIRATGTTANRVMVTETSAQSAGALNGHSPLWLEILDTEAKWLDAIQADKSTNPQPMKVAANKPKELVDACYTWDAKPIKIVEPQTMTGGLCNNLYRTYTTPRIVAGGGIGSEVIKCQLRPIDLTDFKVTLTADQTARLQRIFADGVCDWSKPGVNQVPLMGTWLSFGPSPKLATR
ncbi:MAG: DUF6351 family protein [Bauldia sp.]